MTLAEFKAWFEGFTESIDGAPTKKQWERIQARVAEIDGQAVTERIYLDRYVPSYPVYPYYRRTDVFGPIVSWNPSSVGKSSGETFNSAVAMHSVGRADFASIQ